MRNTCFRLAVAVGALTLATAVNASTISNSLITFLASSSTAFPGYPIPDAVDTGVGSQFTDYASASLGNATHLDMNFGTPQTFQSIAYTDRVTSGGGNGAFVGGNFDFVTSFDYIFATDAAFTNVVGTISVTKTAPASPTTPADFKVTTTIPNITAQFLRWQVIATNGVNPGASNFDFVGATSAVPEPATMGLLGSALLGLGLLMRKRGSSIV